MKARSWLTTAVEAKLAREMVAVTRVSLWEGEYEMI